jgi:hypothetical protein
VSRNQRWCRTCFIEWAKIKLTLADLSRWLPELDRVVTVHIELKLSARMPSTWCVKTVGPAGLFSAHSSTQAVPLDHQLAEMTWLCHGVLHVQCCHSELRAAAHWTESVQGVWSGWSAGRVDGCKLVAVHRLSRKCLKLENNQLANRKLLTVVATSRWFAATARQAIRSFLPSVWSIYAKPPWLGQTG